jgi:hypothetical protein
LKHILRTFGVVDLSNLLSWWNDIAIAIEPLQLPVSTEILQHSSCPLLAVPAASWFVVLPNEFSSSNFRIFPNCGNDFGSFLFGGFVGIAVSGCGY